MRLLIFIFFILISNVLFSQSDRKELNFDIKYYDAVDKWVAFPKSEKDSTFIVGFIYIDAQAGFTFDYKGRFLKTENSLQIIPNKIDAGIKSRLSTNTMNVAILSEKQILELELPKVPEWLSIYKRDEDKVNYLKNIGYHYNAVGASNLALAHLEKAYEMDPHFDGLEFELAYAYNGLNKFNEAIPILQSAIKNDKNNFLFYRELGFSYKNLNQLEKAEVAYRNGIKLTTNRDQIAEMAVNMAQSYYEMNNTEKFKEWSQITRKNCEKNSPFLQYIITWEKDLKTK